MEYLDLNTDLNLYGSLTNQLNSTLGVSSGKQLYILCWRINAKCLPWMLAQCLSTSLPCSWARPSWGGKSYLPRFTSCSVQLRSVLLLTGATPREARLAPCEPKGALLIWRVKKERQSVLVTFRVEYVALLSGHSFWVMEKLWCWDIVFGKRHMPLF